MEEEKKNPYRKVGRFEWTDETKTEFKFVECEDGNVILLLPLTDKIDGKKFQHLLSLRLPRP